MIEVSTTNGITQLAYVFGAGFLSSLTPCVYPMIPITLSIFGASGDIPRWKAFLISLMYVLGIATTYTCLGILTAKTGMIFGSLLNNPFVIVALCVFLLLLSLHSLEILTLQTGKLQSRASKVGGKGMLGAFLMGTVSGIVAAPCVGPVLVVILMQAAKAGNAVWGGMLLFSYSMGLGVIFLALGTFSGLLAKLPRSGNWLLGVKFIIAVGVLMAAVWLLSSLSLSGLNVILSAGTTLSVVVILCSLVVARFSFKKRIRSGQFVSALALAVFSMALIIPVESQQVGQVSTELEWKETTVSAMSVAQKENKPVMLDLYADWCAACKELEALTFADTEVAKHLNSGFIPARVNFTEESDETEEISEKYEVFGLPCILFLTPDGAEIPGSRVTGFMDAAQFLEHLNGISKIQQAKIEGKHNF